MANTNDLQTPQSTRIKVPRFEVDFRTLVRPFYDEKLPSGLDFFPLDFRGNFMQLYTPPEKAYPIYTISERERTAQLYSPNDAAALLKGFEEQTGESAKNFDDIFSLLIPPEGKTLPWIGLSDSDKCASFMKEGDYASAASIIRSDTKSLDIKNDIQTFYSLMVLGAAYNAILTEDKEGLVKICDEFQLEVPEIEAMPEKPKTIIQKGNLGDAIVKGALTLGKKVYSTWLASPKVLSDAEFEKEKQEKTFSAFSQYFDQVKQAFMPYTVR